MLKCTLFNTRHQAIKEGTYYMEHWVWCINNASWNTEKINLKNFVETYWREKINVWGRKSQIKTWREFRHEVIQLIIQFNSIYRWSWATENVSDFTRLELLPSLLNNPHILLWAHSIFLRNSYIIPLVEERNI